MQWDMERDSAFVTGGGSGIGQAIALKLGEQGVKVAVADVDAAKAEGTASLITANGGTALPLALDVTPLGSGQRRHRQDPRGVRQPCLPDERGGDLTAEAGA